MPFARIDLIKGKPSDYRAKVADIVYEGIVGVLKAPDGDRFIVVNEHAPENLIYDRHFLDMDRSPDFILIQVTSTVGNTKELKFAFYRQIADELTSKLGVRPDDIMINMVFVNKEDWFPAGRGANPGDQYRDVVALVQCRNDHHADPSW